MKFLNKTLQVDSLVLLCGPEKTEGGNCSSVPAHTGSVWHWLCHWATTQSARLLFSILFLGFLGTFCMFWWKNYSKCLLESTSDLQNFYFLCSFPCPRPGFLKALFSSSVRVLQCFVCSKGSFQTAADTRVQTCCLSGCSLDMEILFLISMGGLSPWAVFVQTQGCANKLLYKAQLSQLLHQGQYMSSQQSEFLTEIMMSSVHAVLRWGCSLGGELIISSVLGGRMSEIYLLDFLFEVAVYGKKLLDLVIYWGVRVLSWKKTLSRKQTSGFI